MQENKNNKSTSLPSSFREEDLLDEHVQKKLEILSQKKLPLLKRLEYHLRNLLGVSKEEGWDVVFDRLFSRLAFLEQEPEEKGRIAKRIVTGLATGPLYWIEVALSSLIATLGLLQNSVAVILGAMLIAPLLRPIQGLAYAISVGRPHLFIRAVRLLFLSVVLAIFVAWGVLWVLPASEPTPEILARTSPNLLDLWIAIFSALIAILAHVYTRLHESVAGVAMATALIPPLAVVGIELYWGNLEAALGGFMLFFTNLVAILVVGVVLFIFYGFNPHREQATSSLKKITFLFFIVFILWFGFSYNLKKIHQERTLKLEAQKLLQNTFQAQIPGGRLKGIRITPKEGYYLIEGEMFIPENVAISKRSLEAMEKTLSHTLGKEFQLKFDILRTVRLDNHPSIFSQ